MKVECIKKTVDLNKIHLAIDHFKVNHRGENPSYLIMNYETHDKIEHMFNNEVEGDRSYIIYKQELFGIEVALSAGLKFGEVDIV